MSLDPKKFAARIRQLRKSKGFKGPGSVSADEDFPIAESTLVRWEDLRQGVPKTLLTAAAAADYFGVTLDYLVGRSDAV